VDTITSSTLFEDIGPSVGWEKAKNSFINKNVSVFEFTGRQSRPSSPRIQRTIVMKSFKVCNEPRSSMVDCIQGMLAVQRGMHINDINSAQTWQQKVSF